MRTSRPIRIAALAGAVVVLAAIGCGTPDAPQPTGPAAAGATYVGRDKCVACHEDEGKLHAGSDHDLAMQPATPQTVVGDFGGSTFTHFGVTSTFSRRGDEYFAETDGPDGKLHEYKIAYTFGVRPLQQYLIEFPGGSYQALNVCWDTHDRADGGKRWFHLYPNEEVNSRDPLHWTGAYQNWNYMCAECHSTNLQKNWDPAAERYNTTWSEISVSCEACHGPGSNHVAWAEAAAKGTPPDVAYKGLVFRLDGRSSGEWKWVEGKSTAVRTAPIPSRSELETCARCHAERVQVWGDYTYGRPLADNYKIAFLDENLYYADGQIQGEVYEYDSFVQSKMFRAGVTCTNCHDPHSQKTWLEGNALCGQCHSAAAFDTTGHTFHKPGSEGSRCVECHMPSRNYMVVDPRRDHSYRVPRPDLSVKYGVPNACVTCHKDRTDAWAAKAAAEWWPRIVERPTYTEAIWAGRGWKAGAAAMLARTIGDRDAPAIVRATALRLIRNYPPTLAPDQLAGVLGDADPLVRRAGVELLDIYDPQSQLRLGSPLLADPMRTVRLAAALVVVGAGGSLATGEQGRVLAAALDEYRRSQIFNGDRAESHMNLGALAAQLGHTDEAEAEYRTAIRMQPLFLLSYINLADLYRQTGRDAEGEQVLRSALAIDAKDPDAHHALGLLLVRLGRKPEAVAEFARASELSPNRPDYLGVYALSLHDTGSVDRSIAVLEQGQKRFPAHRELLVMLASYATERGRTDDATKWAALFVAEYPNDPDARAFATRVGAR